jgi:poly(A) polymerase
MAYESVYEALEAGGYSLSLSGFSAVDTYMGFASLPFTWAETDADISGLARLFEGLRFPGVDLADGALDAGGQIWYFRCLDADESPQDEEFRSPAYKLLSLTQNWRTKRFRDPCGLYPQIRKLRDGADRGEAPPWWRSLNARTDQYRAAIDGALILARYGTADTPPPLTEIVRSIRDLPPGSPPNAEGQRVLLTSLLVSPRPDLGLELLKAWGMVEELWPELAMLDNVNHSKEYHPEGNVWRHTMETFRYRKDTLRGRTAYDFRLSLGLLLHDVGKPLSASSGTRRFDGHAEIGARAARRFLERLEFEPPVIEDIFYLVKNHMIPAALKRLPLARTREIMESPLFPTLMELYRCDESSSFKGLDGYFENSAAYQSYLRNLRNPYRSADGKKMGRNSPAGR